MSETLDLLRELEAKWRKGASNTADKSGWPWSDAAAMLDTIIQSAEKDEQQLLEARLDAKGWKGNHNELVKKKRNGSARMKAHYETKIAELEQQRETVAALPDKWEARGSHKGWVSQTMIDELRAAIQSAGAKHGVTPRYR